MGKPKLKQKLKPWGPTPPQRTEADQRLLMLDRMERFLTNYVCSLAHSPHEHSAAHAVDKAMEAWRLINENLHGALMNTIKAQEDAKAANAQKIAEDIRKKMEGPDND